MANLSDLYNFESVLTGMLRKQLEGCPYSVYLFGDLGDPYTGKMKEKRVEINISLGLPLEGVYYPLQDGTGRYLHSTFESTIECRVIQPAIRGKVNDMGSAIGFVRQKILNLRYDYLNLGPTCHDILEVIPDSSASDIEDENDHNVFVTTLNFTTQIAIRNDAWPTT